MDNERGGLIRCTFAAIFAGSNLHAWRHAYPVVAADRRRHRLLLLERRAVGCRTCFELGRNACRAADVQWLDQAVHATGMRLSRGEDGRLGFERTFKFEYSYDGIDRHVGRMVLRGDQLISFTGPGAARISQIRADVEDAEDI